MEKHGVLSPPDGSLEPPPGRLALSWWLALRLQWRRFGIVFECRGCRSPQFKTGDIGLTARIPTTSGVPRSGKGVAETRFLR
jgi:hypothetical protein